MSDSNVLNAIIEGVLEDVEKRVVPISQLREQIENAPPLRGAYKSLNQPGMRLIAEVKRSSPSKGELASIPDPQLLAEKYQEGGADLISVLTEERRFKGSIADWISVKSAIDLPVLRKDFIVTEFQVFESPSRGPRPSGPSGAIQSQRRGGRQRRPGAGGFAGPGGIWAQQRSPAGRGGLSSALFALRPGGGSVAGLSSGCCWRGWPP